jgi:hypothetical protein
LGEAQHLEVFYLKEVDEKGTARGANSKGEAKQLGPIIGLLLEKELDGGSLYNVSDAH